MTILQKEKQNNSIFCVMLLESVCSLRKNRIIYQQFEFK